MSHFLDWKFSSTSSQNTMATYFICEIVLFKVEQVQSGYLQWMFNNVFVECYHVHNTITEERIMLLCFVCSGQLLFCISKCEPSLSSFMLRDYPACFLMNYLTETIPTHSRSTQNAFKWYSPLESFFWTLLTRRRFSWPLMHTVGVCYLCLFQYRWITAHFAHGTLSVPPFFPPACFVIDHFSLRSERFNSHWFYISIRLCLCCVIRSRSGTNAHFRVFLKGKGHVCGYFRL